MKYKLNLIVIFVMFHMVYSIENTADINVPVDFDSFAKIELPGKLDYQFYCDIGVYRTNIVVHGYIFNDNMNIKDTVDIIINDKTMVGKRIGTRPEDERRFRIFMDNVQINSNPKLNTISITSKNKEVQEYVFVMGIGIQKCKVQPRESNQYGKFRFIDTDEFQQFTHHVHHLYPKKHSTFTANHYLLINTYKALDGTHSFFTNLHKHEYEKAFYTNSKLVKKTFIELLKSYDDIHDVIRILHMTQENISQVIDIMKSYVMNEPEENTIAINRHLQILEVILKIGIPEYRRLKYFQLLINDNILLYNEYTDSAFYRPIEDVSHIKSLSIIFQYYDNRDWKTPMIKILEKLVENHPKRYNIYNLLSQLYYTKSQDILYNIDNAQHDYLKSIDYVCKLKLRHHRHDDTDRIILNIKKDKRINLDKRQKDIDEHQYQYLKSEYDHLYRLKELGFYPE